MDDAIQERESQRRGGCDHGDYCRTFHLLHDLIPRQQYARVLAERGAMTCAQQFLSPSRLRVSRAG